MATRLTKTEVQLLKVLKAAGKHGRHISGISSAVIAHLRGAQYVKRLPGMKHYERFSAHAMTLYFTRTQ